MDADTQNEREVRAARNQSLFRAVNERLVEVDRAVDHVTDPLVIACECADVNCLETLQIPLATYQHVRADATRFAVLPGHLYPEVEDVVAEAPGYVIVEKLGTAGEVAAILSPSGGE